MSFGARPRGARRRRPWPARIVAWAAALALPAAHPAAAQEDPGALVARMQAAWTARSLADYLALWRFDSPEARAAEEQFARESFAAQDARVLFDPPASFPASGQVKLMLRTFAASEPRARVEQWGLVVQRTTDGWRIRQREPAGRIDGLVHLSLDPAGFRADGKVLSLEDCELRMRRGTLFTTPPALGPTALLFVGDGTLRITPRPATEREQLRQFWGHGELVQRVDRVFVRLHPADLSRVLAPAALEPDPEAARRLSDARSFFDQHAGSAFVIEADLPGAPWWAQPAPGDALLMFKSRKGVLSFTVSGSQAESISLFDRGRRAHICLYPAEGRSRRYSEDALREADTLHHDLKVSFDPRQQALRGEDTLRLRLLRPVASLRLRLKDSLRVRSISSGEAGGHLFFRVRNQDSVVVALGPLGALEEFTLQVAYEGRLDPDRLTDEVQAPGGEPRFLFGEGAFIEEVQLYSNHSLWYPQPSDNDYAEARLRLDTPDGYLAVAPGEPAALTSADGRVSATYVLRQPGKYLSVALGRLSLAGERQVGATRLNAYATGLRRGDAAGVLDQAAEIIDFYTSVFGPCPYAPVNFVLLQGFAPGGHSPPGMVVLSARSPFAGRLADDPASFDDVPYFYMAHELAHQWWGQGVAGQNYHESWLSEGAAQYAAAMWVQHARGQRTLQGVLRRLQRWALRMGSHGPISLGFRLGHIQHDRQIYRAVVYNKGAAVLHMLRAIVGDQAFREGLHAFQEQHRYAKAGTDDLRAALERASGRDLAAYFDAWVLGTGVPRLRGSFRTQSSDGGHRTTVTVQAGGLPGPVPLELALERGGARLVRRVTLEPGGGSYTLDTDFKPSRLELNTDNTLLAEID